MGKLALFTYDCQVVLREPVLVPSADCGRKLFSLHVGSPRSESCDTGRFSEVARLPHAADSGWISQYSETCPVLEHARSKHGVSTVRELILVESLSQGGSTCSIRSLNAQMPFGANLPGPLREARLAYLHHRAEQGALRSTLRKLGQYLLVITERLNLQLASLGPL